MVSDVMTEPVRSEMSELTHAPCRDPEELGRLFAQRLNARDLDGLTRLYEQGATLASPDGVNASGHDAIRQRLEEMLTWTLHIVPLDSRALVADDIALISHRWALAGPGAGGQGSGEGRANSQTPVTSTEVARRQPDGSWRYVIDDPASSVASREIAR
jgi:ketosteroid isomerase-like protein